MSSPDARSDSDTASTAFLDALVEAGVEYLFANLGSDHPALIEAIAARASDGPNGADADHLSERDGRASAARTALRRRAAARRR